MIDDGVAAPAATTMQDTDEEVPIVGHPPRTK